MTRLRIGLLPVLLLGIGLLTLTCLPILTGEFQPTGSTFNLNSNIAVTKITGSKTGWDQTAMYAVDFKAHSISSGNESDVLPAYP